MTGQPTTSGNNDSGKNEEKTWTPYEGARVRVRFDPKACQCAPSRAWKSGSIGTVLFIARNPRPLRTTTPSNPPAVHRYSVVLDGHLPWSASLLAEHELEPYDE